MQAIHLLFLILFFSNGLVTSIVAPRIVFFLCDNLDEDVVKEDEEEDGEESPEGAVEAAAEAEEKEEEEDREGSPEDGEKSPEDAVEDIEDGESKTLSIQIIKYEVVACFCFALSLLPNVLSA
jgi:hypothetical protein